MDKVDGPLRWFFTQVYEKMSSPKNIAKPHWGHNTDTQLLERARGELKELEDEIINGDPAKIIYETCDVTAFMMMIADNARGKAGQDRDAEQLYTYKCLDCGGLWKGEDTIGVHIRTWHQPWPKGFRVIDHPSYRLSVCPECGGDDAFSSVPGCAYCGGRGGMGKITGGD